MSLSKRDPSKMTAAEVAMAALEIQKLEFDPTDPWYRKIVETIRELQLIDWQDYYQKADRVFSIGKGNLQSKEAGRTLNERALFFMMRECSLMFGCKPTEILDDNEKTCGVIFEKCISDFGMVFTVKVVIDRNKGLTAKEFCESLLRYANKYTLNEAMRQNNNGSKLWRNYYSEEDAYKDFCEWSENVLMLAADQCKSIYAEFVDFGMNTKTPVVEAEENFKRALANSKNSCFAEYDEDDYEDLPF